VTFIAGLHQALTLRLTALKNPPQATVSLERVDRRVLSLLTIDGNYSNQGMILYWNTKTPLNLGAFSYFTVDLDACVPPTFAGETYTRIPYMYAAGQIRLRL
jgi:hypothetical protein